ncbi:MAG: ComEC/Rec2 family competence protein [Candidatus Staskawiczbacteria bacterium]|nr:ComEC/Rec2 family competence protein [Candidatus Staskawiczbacteria bacterium]
MKITGKLETPAIMEDFNYKNYLLKDHIYSVMTFPKIELIDRHPMSISSIFYSEVLFLKQKLRETIRRNFLPPEDSIMEAMLLGDSGQLSEDLKNKLNITGLRHIIAVSGTHVIILSAILMSLFLSVGLWRSQAFYFSIVLIFFYIILTGLSASGIRAGIMGGLYLTAQKLGRQSIGPRPVAIAGAAMLGFNPLLLFYDIGFQLSFLAVIGLIYLDPVIKFFLKSKWKKILKNKGNSGKENNFISTVSATFAAQVFTLPVIMFNFGNISFVSPITNMLVLPIVYLLMVFGFLSAALGAVSLLLGLIFSIPCQFFLFYFIKITDIFSGPWAVKTISNISWVWLAVSYLLIAVTVRFLNKILIKSRYF